MSATNSGAAVNLEPIPLLYVLDQLWSATGGTESQFFTLLRRLDRRRFSPAVVLLRGENTVSPSIPDVPVQVLGVGSLRSPKFLACALRLAQRVRRGNIRIAHIFFNDAAIALPPFLRLSGAKVIVSRRDLGFWYTSTNLPLLRAVRPAVNAVIANSEAVKRVVVENERYERNRVTVIPNGFDPRGELLGRVGARRKLGIALERPVITVVANLRPLKRITDAIRAVAALRAEFPSVLLQLVGEDSHRTGEHFHGTELKALVAQLGVASAVSFVGVQADPMPYVEAANVCLLCSEEEGLSNSIIEYMWAGRAVVCTDAGGNPELIANGETGFVVPVGAVDQIVDRLRAMLSSDADAIGMRAREFALRNFSSDVMVRRYVSFYERLLGLGSSA
jgi:L-malate glycosyltransferase